MLRIFFAISIVLLVSFQSFASEGSEKIPPFLRIFGCVPVSPNDELKAIEVFIPFIVMGPGDWKDGFAVLSTPQKPYEGNHKTVDGLHKTIILAKITSEQDRGTETFKVSFEIDKETSFTVAFKDDSHGSPQPAKALINFEDGKLKAEFLCTPDLAK